jgi:hypothetical protein
MSAAFAALREQSLRMLAVIGSGTQDETLPELLNVREEMLRECAAALARGETIEAVAADEILRIERDLTGALCQRRDEVYRDLTALRRGRSAAAAYRHGSWRGEGPVPFLDGTAGYIDREG